MASNPFDLSSLGVNLAKPTPPTTKHSMLLYGRMRTGKSTLAASAAEVDGMWPILWIAAEDGTTSFAGKYDDRIDVVKPGSWSDIQNVVETLVDNETKYKTVVVDTLVESQEFIRKEYLAASGGKGDYAMWDKVAEGVIWLSKTLHNSQYNFIGITHHEKTKDDVVGNVLISPLFQGKKALANVPKVYDTIAYLAKGEDDEGEPVRKLVLTALDNVDAGSRLEHILPPGFINPTMSKFMEPIFQEAAKNA